MEKGGYASDGQKENERNYRSREHVIGERKEDRKIVIDACSTLEERGRIKLHLKAERVIEQLFHT